WDFPKAHWKHVVQDIWNKGAARNYSTCPNEKMHGPLKDAYRDHSNGKDVAVQVSNHFVLLKICSFHY
ncbi:hypothetical protein HYDPIDRAFT_103369, partial [Hydnomerulius pinastri MD-312]